MKPGQLTKTKKKTLWPLLWIGFNRFKATERLRGGSLLFITKFPEIRKYNLRNIILENSYTKCGGETIPRPFSKNSKLGISLDQYFKVLYIFFSLFAKLRTIEIDLN